MHVVDPLNICTLLNTALPLAVFTPNVLVYMFFIKSLTSNPELKKGS